MVLGEDDSVWLICSQSAKKKIGRGTASARRRVFLETLEDRRVLAVFSIDNPAPINEGNAGTQVISFTVSRDDATAAATRIRQSTLPSFIAALFLGKLEADLAIALGVVRPVVAHLDEQEQVDPVAEQLRQLLARLV